MSLSLSAAAAAPAAAASASPAPAANRISIVEAAAADAAEEEKYVHTEEKQAAPSAVDLSAAFLPLPFASVTQANPAVKHYLHKWNVTPTLCQLKLRYTVAAPNFADAAALHAFLVALVDSQAFREGFRCYDATSRSMRPLPAAAITKVNSRPVRASHVDLHLFDRLWADEGAIVYGSASDAISELKLEGEAGAASDKGESGMLRKCFEDVVDGVPITDELRKLVLDRDSDNFELFSPAERQELMFVLFQHLIVGGGLNQYEDSCHPYLGVLRLLYKEALSVRTNRNTGQLEIANLVYRIDSIASRESGSSEETVVPLFGKKPADRHHLFLLSIDPLNKHVTVYYFAHVEAW